MLTSIKSEVMINGTEVHILVGSSNDLENDRATIEDHDRELVLEEEYKGTSVYHDQDGIYWIFIED